MTPTTFHQSDVFRWRYSNPYIDGDRLSYWCKSRIAIVTDGVLRDTYWYAGANAVWSFVDAATKLDLTYLGNLKDYDKRPEWDAVYYDDVDCLDLNHANSSKGNFYVRNGAVRSAAKILETIQVRREQAQRNHDAALREIQRLDELAAEIAAGKLPEELYL